MERILITGATGNVGKEVIKYLSQKNGDFRIVAGVREISPGNAALGASIDETVHFDFSNEKTFSKALKDCDILFLLRPPQLSDVNKFFKPLIKTARANNVKHIVFLSVQGVESSSIIPHHKIEKLIVESGIPYTFLRPAYFMQNFTTTLRKDIVENNMIFLPAGKAKFTLIDVADIGAVAAEVLIDTQSHINKAYDLTNAEQLSFEQMSSILSEELGRRIDYTSPNLLWFYFRKRREGVPSMFILVMIMLHYLPRFQSTPETSNWVERLTGKKPKTFSQFVEVNQALLN